MFEITNITDSFQHIEKTKDSESQPAEVFETLNVSATLQSIDIALYKASDHLSSMLTHL